MRYPALLALTAVTLLACDRPATGPSSDAPAGTALQATAANGPKASGHGNLTVADELRTFSFTAVTHQDGSVTGQAQLNNRAQDARIHLEIDCLLVIGNRAVMSGVVTNTNDPVFEGLTGTFRVTDNGEGANDPPDTISLVFFGFPPQFCRTNVPLPEMPIEGGNIQVKP